MKNILKITTGLFATSLLAACSVSFTGTEKEQGQYYSGYVYDGLTAQPVTGYKLNITYNSVEAGDTGKLAAKVDSKTGFYTVGPVRPGSDFVLEISKEGYRSFMAAEDGDYWLPGGEFDQYTDIVEAWIFPSDIAVPAATISLWSENVDQPRPTGKARIAPANPSNPDSALELTDSFPTIAGQRWFNDLDAHAKSLPIVDVTDGELVLPVDQLVYGVTYTVTVFSVDGHRYRTFNFTAGLTGDTYIQLEELDNSNLQLVSTNIDNGNPSPKGQLVITLNRAVEFDPQFTEEYYKELLDDNFAISTADVDTDGDVNTLANNGVNANDQDGKSENGTSIKIDGNVITLSWAAAAANFDPQDTDDPIYGVTWGNLSGILIRTIGEENDTHSLDEYVDDYQYVPAISTPL